MAAVNKRSAERQGGRREERQGGEGHKRSKQDDDPVPNFVPVRRHVPPGYVCHRCNVPGHLLSQCPILSGATWREERPERALVDVESQERIELEALARGRAQFQAELLAKENDILRAREERRWNEAVQDRQKRIDEDERRDRLEKEEKARQREREEKQRQRERRDRLEKEEKQRQREKEKKAIEGKGEVRRDDPDERAITEGKVGGFLERKLTEPSLSVSHLLDLCSEDGQKWNGVQTAAVMHSLSRIYRQTSIPEQRVLRALLLERKEIVMKMIDAKKEKEYTTVAYAHIAYALAQLDLAHPSFFMSAMTCITRHIRTISLRSLSLLAWAYAKSELDHQLRGPVIRDAFNMMAERVMAHVAHADPEIITRVMWAFATLQLQNTALFKTIAAECLTTRARLERFDDQELCLLASSFGRLHHLNEALFARIADLASTQIHHYTPPRLQMLAVGFSEVGVKNETLLHLIAEQILQKKMTTFSSRQLVIMAGVFATFQIQNPAFMTELSRHFREYIALILPVDLASLAHSFATLRIQDEPLMKAIAAHVIGKEAQIDTRALSEFSWSFGILRMKHVALCTSLVANALPRLGAFTPQALADFVAGLAFVDAHEDLKSVMITETKDKKESLGEAFLGAVAHEIKTQLKKFPLKAITSLAFSLLKMQLPDPALFTLLQDVIVSFGAPKTP